MVCHAQGYKSYKARIPNGGAVPHPCKSSTLWEGVGHFLDIGTGPRNPFGLDFAAEGLTWTTNLCRKDSDGDGRTNGQELGDPNCTWTLNSTPTQATGICDPWDSPTCLQNNVTHPLYKTQGDWLKAACKSGDFVCPAKNESGVQKVNLRLANNTAVPSKATTYMCQMFNMEAVLGSRDFHLVSTEPIIGNSEVLHHMGLFGCEDGQEMIDAPFECGMLSSSKCQTTLSVWSVGLSGDCFHPMAGVKLGRTGYKKFAIQYHWNNPNHRTDWTDTSGMKIYYTPNLRQFDAGILVSGVQSFVLPPRRQSLTVSGTCPAGCTRDLMSGPINITKAWNHMHYASIEMSIEIKRNKTHYMYLTDDPVYSYDSPQVYSYTDNPVTLLPGDEIVTKCTYSTANRNHSTLSGEGTYDEMCFGFISYFPSNNFNGEFCISAEPNVSFCAPDAGADMGCPEFYSFFNGTMVGSSSQYTQLVENCQPFSPCLEECVQYLVQLRQSSGCFQGELFELIKSQMLKYHEVGRDMMARMASCEVQVYALLHPPPTESSKLTRVTSSTVDAGALIKASLTSVTSLVLLSTFGLFLYF
ncbi:hypothetical protein Btru_069949 [Bulinus truncatus]|nr:hypothetical protein Btru_069949 [Bulinus truncatus]